MSFEVLYTDNFARELKQLAKKYRSIKEDLGKLISSLEKNPIQGKSIGKSCYKIRMAIASKGKGKSGGARVITHLFVQETTVYLLSIYDKSEKENIDDMELMEWLKKIKS
ncbi:MAG: type II toxin-antitoxin system RelE/ParE family toxin [Crocinitomicaceae bacterium]|nr:type II toxin-antitoxin system RelE/ParE family toxin [Crocinitomicaceae bacterium]MBK8924838.1 type II toxin-antitoxin system RelE/ParE family toxin [Crocinitomicaceae bacterium]